MTIATTQYCDAVSQMDARLLGLRRRGETGAGDCGAILNSMLSQWGVASPDFSTLPDGVKPVAAQMGIDNKGGWYDFSTKILMDAHGGCLRGNGFSGDLWGINEYNASGSTGRLRRGNATRFNWTGAKPSAGVPLIDVAAGAGGCHLGQFFLIGREAANQAALWADSANYAPIGILVRTEAGGVMSDAIQIGACEVGLQFGETSLPSGNHADHCGFQSTWFNHCLTGMQFNTIQAVNSDFGYVHCYGCPVGVDIALGGQLTFKQIYYGKGALAMDSVVKVGTVGSYSQNADTINLGLVALDNTVGGVAVGSQPIALNVLGSGHGTINCTVHLPHDNYNPSAGMFVINSGWRVNVWGGKHLKEGCVRFLNDSNTANADANISFYGCTMAAGHDPALLIHGSNAGTGTIGVYGCFAREGGNSFGGWSRKWAEYQYADSTTPTTRSFVFA